MPKLKLKTKFISITFLAVPLAFLLVSGNKKRETSLESKLAELESYIPKRDSLNTEISQMDVAWHLDHTLRTINEIYRTMEKSDPVQYRGSVHLGRSFLLLINKIPRGRAEAPDIVRPPKVVLTDSLYYALEKANQNLVHLETLPKKAYFEHPYLGALKKRTAIRFIEIHTEHHLKIIRDILTKNTCRSK